MQEERDGFLAEFSAWLTSPFRNEIPLGQLIAVIGVYIVLVWIVWDVLLLIKEFAASAVEAAAEVI